MAEIDEKIRELKERLMAISQKLNIEEKKKQIKHLEGESALSNFWQNPEEGAKKMQELAELQNELKAIEEIDENLELVTTDEELGEINQELEKLERKTFLSGEHDKSEAILSVHAGQGGTEACDWASMLLRMYARFAERQGWKWEMIAESRGEEAGIKSATILIHGRFAYGNLKHEKGTHRLVRQSPFNANNLRQTSFALVEALPTIPETAEVKIRPEEIDFQTFRASGHGGQNVNKVSTAVRIKHLPTGIIVECQTERSQQQNRKIAEDILRAKLWEKMEQKREAEISKLKGVNKKASWGTQIRSYVLHPYQMVKDLRTNWETADTIGVLDGKLEDFINQELKAL